MLYVIMLSMFVLIFPSDGLAFKMKNPFLDERKQMMKEEFDHLAMVQEFKMDIEQMSGHGEMNINLEDVNRIILEQNTDIKISKLALDTREREIAIERAVYDLTATSSYGFNRARTPNSNAAATLSETSQLSFGVAQELVTGSNYSLTYNSDRSGRKHSYDSDVTFSFTQSLLQGFTSANLAPIKVAQNNYKISLEEVKKEIIDQISAAQTAYWEILRAREILSARQRAHAQALKLVEQNKKEMDLGKKTYTDVLQAEASAASREVDVLEGENTLRNREDELRQLFHMKSPALWGQKISIEDSISFEEPGDLPGLAQAMEVAFLNRQDFRQAILELKNNQLEAQVAKNNLLPELSATSSFSFNGLGEDSRSAVNRAFSGHFPDWEIFVEFTMPWLERADRESYQQAKNEIKQQEFEIQSLVLTMVKEIRTALRRVETSAKQMRVTELAHELEVKKLDAETRKYDLGYSTSFYILRFQEDLANAAVSRIGAVVDYHLALIELWRVMGNTLNVNGIEVS